MQNKFLKSVIVFISMFLWNSNCHAQLSPIDFELGGYGSTWNWTVFENDTNPALQIITNPVPGGINNSDKVAKFTALQNGQPWAGFESLHGGGIGTFTLDSTNCIIKVMVYKSVISDVGVKLVTPSAASTGELKVSNTVINQWEELTFDFTNQIGHPAMIGLDQIVIFPDFDLNGRTSDNICYIDNITTGMPSQPINVKFEVQNTDSTPVYVFGDWNNWSNYPGIPMTLNSFSGNYEANLVLPPNTDIEYLFVNGTTKEILNPNWACTNGNVQHTNRLTTLGTNDTTLCNVWASCSSCIPLNISSLKSDNIEVLLGLNMLRIVSNSHSLIDEVNIYNQIGQKIYESKKINTNQNIPIALKANTIYIVQIKNNNETINTKTIITKK